MNDIIKIIQNEIDNFRIKINQETNEIIKSQMSMQEYGMVKILKLIESINNVSYFNIDTVKDMIRESFSDGELWGVTYSTWFDPKEEDTEEKIQETINRLLNKEEKCNEG